MSSTNKSLKIGLKEILIGLALIVAILIGMRYRFPTAYFRIATWIPLLASEENQEYQLAWSSGERSRMRQIAYAAVEYGDPAAINVIFRAARAGDLPGVDQGVTPGIIRTANNPAWEEDLSREDIRSILILALSRLYPEGLEKLPPIYTLHPGVIYALASRVDVALGSPQLSTVSLSQLADLPTPFGDAFAHLEKLGVKNVGESKAIALAALTAGLYSTNTIEVFFGDIHEMQSMFQYLGILLPFFEESNELGSLVFSHLSQRDDAASQPFSWFNQEDIAGWNTLGGSEKIKLVLGKFPSTPLTLEQLSDLLLFPLTSIKESAIKEIKNRYLKDSGSEVLSVLSNPNTKLTRDQTIALTSALNLKGEAMRPFLALWFNMKPDPNVVAELIAARVRQSDNDPFNLEGARYLKNKEWSLPTDKLRILSRHPEALVRSLVYSRLSLKNPDQAKIIDERIRDEKDQSLRGLLIKMRS